MADDQKPAARPAPPPPELQPVRYRQPAGFSIGNWIWRKFVAPFFGG